MGVAKGLQKIVVLCVVTVVVVGAIYYIATSGIPRKPNTPPEIPEEVTLTGTVTTTVTGTIPEKITFTSVEDGMTYVAACEGGGNPASYTISLPNQDTYTVTITWKSSGSTPGGDADAGTLNLDEIVDESIVRNWTG